MQVGNWQKGAERLVSFLQLANYLLAQPFLRDNASHGALDMESHELRDDIARKIGSTLLGKRKQCSSSNYQAWLLKLRKRLLES